MFLKIVFGHLTLEAETKEVEDSIHMGDFSSADSFSPVIKKER